MGRATFPGVEAVRPGTATRGRLALVLSMSLALFASACSTGTNPTTSEASSKTAKEGSIEGTFDVGGHNLFIACEGTGTPTIVYLHSANPDRFYDPHLDGLTFQRELQDDYRVCLYDRRNNGHSETVDAVQTPDDAIADLRNLLAAAEVEPPYVMLGSSLGGLLAYLYANLYAEEVVGIVMLDSPIPEELSLEHFFPPDKRIEAYREQEEGSVERISGFSFLERTQEFIGREPAIPVTYFSSIPEGRGARDFGQDPEYNEVVLDVQEEFVGRFSPGTYIRVDAPHLMEHAIPDQIVEAVRNVVSQAGF
jgi:pimeloyl-ACP methyl ester carboxylesterase